MSTTFKSSSKVCEKTIMSNSNRAPGPIPYDWLYCPRKSNEIIANKFLALKTPLSDAYTNNMPIECLFKPGMIFGYCKYLNLKLGLWIDLTYTNRYYDCSEVQAQKAKYVKLPCGSHEQIPSIEQTRDFINIVDNFIIEKPSDIIGVHCTHGFNRTGFLIVSYLVERLCYSVEAAFSLFARAREPGIYHQHYINELYRRYGNGKEVPLAPEFRAWRAPKRKHEELHHSPNSQEAILERDQNSNVEAMQHKKRRCELISKVNARFMEGLPGVVSVLDQPRLAKLQQKVQKMTAWRYDDTTAWRFPGSQTVSMTRTNIRDLQNIPYRVSWSSDGTRYMMLINKRDEIYLFDCNNSWYQVKNLSFIKSSNLYEHLEDTLIDGVMVLDKYNGSITPRYLIYDILKLANQNIWKEPFFPNRLECIKRELIEPRIKAIANGIIHRASEPFSIRNKEFWNIHQSEALLGEKFIKSLGHEADGLIFQPSAKVYTIGEHADIFKWKSPTMILVDFRVKVRGAECLLYVEGHDKAFAQMKYTEVFKNLDNKIVTCELNRQGQWKFIHERTDKTLPNTYFAAKAATDSVLHPVTKENLLYFIANNGLRCDNNAIITKHFKT